MNLELRMDDEDSFCEICDMTLGNCDCNILEQDDFDDMGCISKGIIQMEDI